LLILFQHILAAGILLLVGDVIFHSSVKVNFLNEDKTYYLDPLRMSGSSFENTEVFTDLLSRSTSDIMTYVSLQDFLETDGSFSSRKIIDVGAFAHYMGYREDNGLSVKYTIEKLVKWGVAGISYTNRSFSLADFVNYYGDVLVSDNFALDEDGNLYFTGFNTIIHPRTWSERLFWDVDEVEEEVDPDDVSLAMAEAGNSVLYRLVYEYIEQSVGSGMNLVQEEDGTLTVVLQLLDSRYESESGGRLLLAMADNWVDYFSLQSDLAYTITQVSESYETYRKAKSIYGEDLTNLTYVIHVGEGEDTKVYTNDRSLREYTSEGLTELFSENSTYLIYYDDVMSYSTLTDVDVSVLTEGIAKGKYFYGEHSRIWIMLDNTYSVEDSFSRIYDVYTDIVSGINRDFLLIIGMGICWLVIFLYMLMNEGIRTGSDGKEVKYLIWSDKIWTELLIVFGVGGYFVLAHGAGDLAIMTENIYQSDPGQKLSMTLLRDYFYFALWGFLLSFLICCIIYTLARKQRNNCLYRFSLIAKLRKNFNKTYMSLSTNRSAVISQLIPFNVFLLSNIAGTALIIYFWSRFKWLSILGVLGLLLVNIVIGVHRFRVESQRKDIVQGIYRIRDGEVDFKIDSEHMIGENRLIAEAINNIGDGMQNAVRTSVRDEKMKSDLITNVSHDLKTPLTSIINYTDLLKRTGITEEPAAGYVKVLDEKSRRLKQLLEDLLEASKISSGTLEINEERIDLTELMNQAVAEFEDKLGDHGLSVVMDSDRHFYIEADSRRMWRIIDNLLQNVCKYAMEGTRVYITLGDREDLTVLEIKNISAKQSSFQGQELTEQFIRGDESRTTEGSGLGLFIAKSLTEAMKGTFEIQMDGDLFKAILTFPAL
jgi:signal transduction histidine kinase